MKMVHNGVEYGMMASIAEGLSIIKHANVGKTTQIADAENTPLRDPDAYQYDIDVGEVAELWRRGSVVGSWLVDLTADAFARSPGSGGVRGPGVGLRRGPMDRVRGDRRGGPGSGDHRLAVRALRVTGPRASSRTRSCRRCEASSAATPRQQS